MEAYKALQEELIKQRELVESKSGTVVVANQNPSPSEITAGIESIPMLDLSNSTATEEDVRYGKTFYSGNMKIKTGNATLDLDAIKAVLLHKEETITYEDKQYYVLPDGINYIRKYAFYQNFHEVDFTFNDDVEVIKDYAFYNTKNFYFNNFDELPNLTELGRYSFSKSSGKGMTFERLPNSLKIIGEYSFIYIVKEYCDFKFPDNLESLGAYTYMSDKRQVQNTLDLSNYKFKMMQPYTFQFHAFNCDLEIPSGVTTIGMYYNYNGCFKNIYIPATVTAIGTNTFGAASGRPISEFYLNSVVFESETPPTMQTNSFATQFKDVGFKIYVPDTAVEEYKATASLANFVDYIYPISEKE